MKAILTYHSVDDLKSAVSVSPSVFADQVRWLQSGAVRVLPLEAILEDRDERDAVAITFDDGLLGARTALEQLAASGLPVTVFVVSGEVGRTNLWNGKPYPGVPTMRLLSWEDLTSLKGCGVSVGAHTKTHRRLTTLSQDQVDEELGGSIEEIAARLGVRPSAVSYPYGQLNRQVAERAARLFRVGVTTEFRALRDEEIATQLPRLDMYYLRAPGALEAWGRGAFSRRMLWYRARRALRGL